MPARKTKPKTASIYKDYRELDDFIMSFAEGCFNLVILVGAPGLQKTRLVKDALVRKPYCILEGYTTPLGMYCKLWKHRDQLVVIDDADSLYAVPSGVRLLKCLCQTEPTKTITWESDAHRLRREGIPHHFTTSSYVIILANDWATLNENVAAIEDRGHVLFFEPSAYEVHRRTANWFWDQEVFDFIGEYLNYITAPSVRHYYRAWELKTAGMDWKESLRKQWLSGPTAAVARLRDNADYTSEQERVQAFEQMGHGTRSTYFLHKRKLPKSESKPRVRLTNDRPPELQHLKAV